MRGGAFFNMKLQPTVQKPPSLTPLVVFSIGGEKPPRPFVAQHDATSDNLEAAAAAMTDMASALHAHHRGIGGRVERDGGHQSSTSPGAVDRGLKNTTSPHPAPLSSSSEARMASPPLPTSKQRNLRIDSSVPSPFGRSDALVVSDTYLTTSFGGVAAFYSLRLGQPCASAVVVHLLLPQTHGDTGSGMNCIKLSSDRIFFAPESFAEPQLVRVDCVDDRAATTVIAHKVYSLDKTYDRVHAPNVVVKTVRYAGGGSFLSFGGQMTKRQAAALGGSQMPTRLDLLVAATGGGNAHAGSGSALSSLSSDTLLSDSSSSTLVGAASSPANASGQAQPPWYASHMASGHHFSLVVVSLPQTDVLLSWGTNANGELGNGATAAVTEPQPVVLTAMKRLQPGEYLRVAQIACGKHHAAVITRSAHLFTWGNNKYGQLGHGDFTSRLAPQEVNFTLTTLAVTSSAHRALRVKHAVERGGTNVTHVCCGAYHTLFVTHQQQILGMGYNQAGQLGSGHRLQQYKGWCSCSPIAVEGLRDRSVLDLAAGQNHSACVLSNGDVYVWGCGDDGRLGTGDRESVSSPTLLSTLRDAKVRARTVRCGARHTAVISDRDLLYVWGANEFGQLGCGGRRTRLRPALVAFPPFVTHGVADVSLGEFHSACVAFSGVAYTWGLDLAAESADVEQRNTPQAINMPHNRVERVRRVSCGWAHTNLSIFQTSADDDPEISSKQATSFHRKLEREKLQLRRDELLRWRAFVSPTVAPMWRQQTKRWRQVKGRVPTASPSHDNDHLPDFDRHEPESAGRLSSGRDISDKRAPLKEFKALVEAYTTPPIKDALHHVAKLLGHSMAHR